MNTIEMRPIRTRYHEPEYYWIIDQKPVVCYLDDYVKDGKCPDLEPSGSMSGLMPAWTGQFDYRADNEFVWEMIDTGWCFDAVPYHDMVEKYRAVYTRNMEEKPHW